MVRVVSGERYMITLLALYFITQDKGKAVANFVFSSVILFSNTRCTATPEKKKTRRKKKKVCAPRTMGKNHA